MTTAHRADTPTDPSISVVVPVYRSEDLLDTLVATVTRALDTAGHHNKYEIILVNDASPDGSWQVILRLAKEHTYVRGISLRRNFGQHNAVMAGLNHARGRIIIVMDDDMQHPSQALQDMIQAIETGNDVCYTRYRNRQHAGWKKLGSRFNGWVAGYLLHKPAGLYMSSFKALSRSLVDEITAHKGPYVYLDGLILDLTRSIASIDVEHMKRPQGCSNYNLTKLISLWLRMATGFSVLPLRLSCLAGVFFFIMSLLLMGVIIIQKLLHPETPAGWSSLASILLFSSGFQLFFIGLVGEYLGRTYMNLNGKPQFSIGRTTWDSSRPPTDDDAAVSANAISSDAP
ncbi:glycosyltransferase family 2 protein [Solidesulfovibrio sp.]|uniref:glycosyltransferase family 2 protein n=1 Tax=Solidesulfovibrio sp. TaxID=2910990 RepID=UPI00260C66CC|nr:glycosyltransferase family 2 protein [Solidesulfovibrio sp.]